MYTAGRTARWMDSKINGKKRIINDILLIVSVLVIAVVLIIAYRTVSSDGTHAAVIIDGKVTDTYPLSEEIEIEIETEYGKNVLRIKDGKAAVTDADCPDLVCARHREISLSGESIVCLPHRLVIEIRD